MWDPVRSFLQILVQTQQLASGLRPAQWLLDNGRDFRPGPLPQAVRRGAASRCYLNSLRLAIQSDGRYVYCEGMASRGTLTTEHAWCYDRQTGLIVDRTWGGGSAYFGVPIRNAYACAAGVRSGAYDPVLWNWRNDLPIMTGAVPERIWREDLP
jgi:hypothetical protein